MLLSLERDPPPVQAVKTTLVYWAYGTAFVLTLMIVLAGLMLRRARR